MMVHPKNILVYQHLLNDYKEKTKKLASQDAGNMHHLLMHFLLLF